MGVRSLQTTYPFLEGGDRAGLLVYIFVVWVQGPHHLIAAVVSALVAFCLLLVVVPLFGCQDFCPSIIKDVLLSLQLLLLHLQALHGGYVWHPGSERPEHPVFQHRDKSSGIRHCFA